MYINPSQNRRLHQLLNQTGLNGQKPTLIYSISQGRTESSKDLSNIEADQLIKYLEQQLDKKDIADKESANVMRRKIIAFCHKLKWYTEDGKIDYKSIDSFCMQRGHAHKPFNDYTVKELPTLVTQFQNVYNSFLKK
jgi:hypothetical protein